MYIIMNGSQPGDTGSGGLNRNHNHEMKEIFKSTATSVSRGRGPFHDFYAALLDKGTEPEMARLTLARKIATITLTLWKKEERFDAEQLKTHQTKPLPRQRQGGAHGSMRILKD
jgi:hypothetical protein